MIHYRVHNNPSLDLILRQMNFNVSFSQKKKSSFNNSMLPGRHLFSTTISRDEEGAEIVNTHSSFSFFLSFSVSSQCAGSEVKPLTEDRGCDNVLLGRSDRTPHGAVIDEYEAMEE
jgi:hypothetical protein